MILPVFRLTLQGFSSRFISGMLDTFTINPISLVALGLQVRALYVKTYVHARLYLDSHWRDFPENSYCMCSSLQYWNRGVSFTLWTQSPVTNWINGWVGIRVRQNATKVKNPAHAPNQNMVIQHPPKQFMTISNPTMKLTFVPQYCYSSKASNINLKPEKHDISRLCLEQQ